MCIYIHYYIFIHIDDEMYRFIRFKWRTPATFAARRMLRTLAKKIHPWCPKGDVCWFISVNTMLQYNVNSYFTPIYINYNILKHIITSNICIVYRTVEPHGAPCNENIHSTTRNTLLDAHSAVINQDQPS